MNKFTIVVLGIFFTAKVWGQFNENLISIKQSSGSHQQWYRFTPSQNLSSTTLIQSYKHELGLSEESDLILIRTDNDNNWTHSRYQQFYNGVKVLGGEIVLHELDDKVHSANGRLVTNLNLKTSALIIPSDAVQVAINSDNSEVFIWESNQDLYPQAELIIFDDKYPESGGTIYLAYKVELFGIKPIQKTRYYVDARTGDILRSENVLMSCFGGGQGIAQTLYHGTRQIETTEDNGEFKLQDQTRGGGITTQSARGTQYSDSDNDWEIGSFTQKVGALDVHFGTQSTYDFYKNSFNRDGIDGKNGRILSRIIDTTTYVNAFWESSTNTTNYGIGDNINTGPLTSLDVVGHEMSHGLTQHTCGLEYLYEAGALNEAISDIMGKTIEFKYDSANFNWLIGEKFFFKKDSAFRSMSDPNLFRNPKYYKGRHWVFSSADNGGVHTNSGVFNYWFYLLVTGQAGINEAGVSFDVNAIGFDEAIDIVYQMMKNYLISTSYFHDAREASLTVAENKYGKCSDQYRNISEAWKAVGVGSNVNEGDLLLVNYKIPQISCKEGLFPVEVRLVNQSCDQTIPAGSEVTLSISVVQKNKIVEYLTLDKDLLPGESFIYKFKELAKIDRSPTIVTVDATLASDSDTTNNRFSMSVTKNNNNEHDFRVSQINISGSPCENNNLMGQLQATYSGCHPVPAGTELDLTLQFDNIVISKKLKTVTTLYPNANYRSTLFPVDRVFAGYKRVNALLNYALDTILINNSTAFNAVYIENTSLGYHETFESGQFDSSLLALRIDSFQTVGIETALTNSPSLYFTGGKIFDASNRLIPFNGATLANFMSSNPKFTSTIYLCLDTKDLTQAFLSFDYMQKTGSTNYDSIMINPSFAAGTRIVFRNDRGGTIGPATYLQNATIEPILRFHEQAIPITGGPISIEITNISLEGQNDINGKIDFSKDLVVMDNIKIYAIPVNTEEKVAKNLIIYPNPFNKILSLNLNDVSNGSEFTINNMQGVPIKNGKLDGKVLEITMDDVASGTYVLKIMNNSSIIRTFKIVKI
jgi:Zn-dependent metalloprotease